MYYKVNNSTFNLQTEFLFLKEMDEKFEPLRTIQFD